jgi:hypothetical protein
MTKGSARPVVEQNVPGPRRDALKYAQCKFQ